ncbi:MAG: DUF1850 domain-containing protein [Pseudaminobacter sp.]
MSLCLLVSGKVSVLAISAFTLAWSHSVEKTRWEEDWRLTPAGLQIVEARIQGSGAGMEPPAEAVLKDGWWVYAPQLPPQPKLLLAASGATGAGWSLCAGGECLELGATPGSQVELSACEGREPHAPAK